MTEKEEDSVANLNKVLLMGNLTRDPELRYLANGTAVANLRLAINRRYRTQNGELKEQVCFVTIVVWGKQAESCSQYLNKGRSVFVEGRLQSRSWETEDGQKRSVIEVRADRVQFLDRPLITEEVDTGAETSAFGEETVQPEDAQIPKNKDLEEELPF
jgi:single-strand DNA-binding protein